MLKHTRKIKELYEDIQRKLYYMVPEKWDSLYLYTSILDKKDIEGNSGELFFYYIPKGIFRKKIVNVYEIPLKFNIDETQYLKLVKNLYTKIKELRKEFEKSEPSEIWSNLTIIIHNSKFKVEYDYTNLSESYLTSYQRHIIWRYEYLGIGYEQLNREEKEVVNSYLSGAKVLSKKEKYETGIYIQEIDNIIGYTTNEYMAEKNYREESKGNLEDKKQELKQELEHKEYVVNQILRPIKEMNKNVSKNNK